MDTLGCTVAEVQKVSTRRLYHWLFGLGMVLVIALGWKYPLLGLAAPLVMVAGMIVSVFHGRYVCGNLCPRGSFFDTALKLMAPAKKAPPLLRAMPFRWAMVAVLLGVTGWQGSAAPTSIEHWGVVFWRLCFVTTLIGVGLSFAYGTRAWCAFCPMGTLQNAIGGHKRPLQVDAVCLQCRECEQNCPMGLAIAAGRDSGQLQNRDCLRCSTCVSTCRNKALSWPEAA